jgi:hypothetical protein
LDAIGDHFQRKDFSVPSKRSDKAFVRQIETGLMVFIVLEVTTLDGVSSITEIIHKKYTHNRSIAETKFAG